MMYNGYILQSLTLDLSWFDEKFNLYIYTKHMFKHVS